MLKITWKQIVNRKKSNIWIVLELLLVFCLIWYMVDYFFVLGYNTHIPSHRDLHNTYQVDIGIFGEDHSEYNPEEGEPQQAISNLYRIVDRIKEHPDVESVALCISQSSFPGSGNYEGSEYRNAVDTFNIGNIQRIRFVPREDYFRVFRHTTANGKTPVSLTDYDWGDPSGIIISRMVEKRLFPGESAVGKVIESNYFSEERYRVMGVVDDVKRFSYLRPYGVIFFPKPLNEENYNFLYIGIRTKKAIGEKQFIKDFKRGMSSRLRIGNCYLKNVTSFRKIEKNTQFSFGITNSIRTHTALMVFFLINIILCVLGTFWYRVNVRKGEIGIRRAMGADANNIKKLFILEGIILLIIVLPLAMLIEIQFVNAGLIDTLGKNIRSYGDYLPDHTLIRFLITNTLTWLLLALVIIIAIWYPARAASRIKPVDALKDE